MNLQKKNGKKENDTQRYAPSVLNLAIGSRVAVNEKLAVQLGLYRGSLGTVVGFVFENEAPDDEKRMSSVEEVAEEDDDREIPIVLVQMDEHYNGPSCIKGMQRVVPFFATQCRSAIRSKYYRFQLPLIPSHARTIHRAQGLTAYHGLIIVPGKRKPKQLGLYYVAISRGKDPDSIYITEPLLESHFVNHQKQYEQINALYEYFRRKPELKQRRTNIAIRMDALKARAAVFACLEAEALRREDEASDFALDDVDADMIDQDDSDVEHESEDIALDANTDNVDEIMGYELMNLDADSRSDNAYVQDMSADTRSTARSKQRGRKRKKEIITQSDIDELRSLSSIEGKIKLAKYLNPPFVLLHEKKKSLSVDMSTVLA